MICDPGYPLNGWLTILNNSETSVKDAPEIALLALSWVLSEPARAGRFLEITGLTPDGLRGALGQPGARRATLVAVLDFLCAHEPDLLAAADSLGCNPAQLASARESLAA